MIELQIIHRGKLDILHGKLKGSCGRGTVIIGSGSVI